MDVAHRDKNSGIVNHHLVNSRSLQITWLLEELQTSYRLKKHQWEAPGLAASSLKVLHPLGTAPVIELDGRYFAETNAIIDLLLDKYDGTPARLRPSSEDVDRGDYLFWFHFIPGSFMPTMASLAMLGSSESTVAKFVRPLVRLALKPVKQTLILPRVQRQMDLVESRLNETSWIAGERFTAADIVVGYFLYVLKYRIDLSEREGIQRYLERIERREAFRKTLEINS